MELVTGGSGKTKMLMKTLRKRKGNWIGHTIRGEDILTSILEGTVDVRRRIGRKDSRS